MHRAADMDRPVAIAGEVCGLQQARGHGRTEELAGPAGQLAIGNESGVLPVECVDEAPLHCLERLPVAARGERIPVLAILFSGYGASPIPGYCARRWAALLAMLRRMAEPISAVHAANKWRMRKVGPIISA